MAIKDIKANKMKVKELRSKIKEVISEIMSGEKPTGAVRVKKGDINTIKKLSAQGIDTIEDPTIREMARIGTGYELVDPEMDSSGYASKKISGVALSDIIDYFKENPGVQKIDIKNHFGFVRPQITNAIINTFIEAGILQSTAGTGVASSRIQADGSIADTPNSPAKFDAEDLFIGNKVTNSPAFSSSSPESSEDDVMDEPEIPAMTPDAPKVKSKISDEDYNAWMKYKETEERLRGIKSALQKGKRMGNGGEFKTDPSGERERLLAKKAELEQRLGDMLATSPYLQAKAAKERGEEINIPTSLPAVDDLAVEPVEDELDEVLLNRFTKLANIK